MNRRQAGLWIGMVMWLLVVMIGGLPVERVSAWVAPDMLDDGPVLHLVAPGARPASQFGFDASLSVIGALPEGALGLPGEPITWIITVTNTGRTAGTDLVVTDTVRDELRIDSVEAGRGDFAISEQMVVFSLPRLEPAETVELRINTTVLRGPTSGVLTNQAALKANGPGGEVITSAATEVFVPTGLPATGYPPESDLPGEGEPSVLAVAALAFGVVALTAAYVWHRGNKI